MILLITGSSASGKTTVARALSEQYQFLHIDGDQVIKDLGLTSKAWNSIHDNLMDRALQFHSDVNIVISHVVLPEKFAYYQEKLSAIDRDFKLVILNPTKTVLYSRTGSRKSHPKPTPLDVIDFFYDSFKSAKATNRTQLVIDNSLQTEQETLESIIHYLEV